MSISNKSFLLFCLLNNRLHGHFCFILVTFPEMIVAFKNINTLKDIEKPEEAKEVAEAVLPLPNVCFKKDIILHLPPWTGGRTKA